MKTVEDFKTKAQERNIRKWGIHNCSGCGYECGYLIDGDQLYYDNGCYCIMYPPNPRDWQDLADHYNRQSYEKYIAEMDEFWGFDAVPKSKERRGKKYYPHKEPYMTMNWEQQCRDYWNSRTEETLRGVQRLIESEIGYNSFFHFKKEVFKGYELPVVPDGLAVALVYASKYRNQKQGEGN